MSSRSPARLPTTTAASPSSSPRLPSPPPLPELQLAPSSPLIQAVESEQRIDGLAVPDEGAHRRVRPGTSAAEMAKGPPFVPLHQLESPFQLQEYLKSLYCNLTCDEESSTVKPITRDTAMQIATPPVQQDTNEPVDKQLWLYELCRFLVQRTNRVIVSCFNDNPPCSSQTCPEMRASEWQYLCAVHEPPKSCCAIDYCCHTLDWAANVLTSTKHFPSRLSLGGEGATAYQSMRQLTNIFRRVYRIYAHAWFQHREVFWSLEQEEGLYKFYKTVCDYYALIPQDNYTVPAEAEGEREDSEEPDSQHHIEMNMYNNETQIHLADTTQQQQQQQSLESFQKQVPQLVQPPSTPQTVPQTQRRHRHTPSTGTQVTSITESEEEEEQSQPPRLYHTETQILDPPPHQAYTRTSPQEHSTPLAMTMPTFEETSSMKPEDPTPKPESHSADPFDDTHSTTSDTTSHSTISSHTSIAEDDQDKTTSAVSNTTTSTDEPMTRTAAIDLPPASLPATPSQHAPAKSSIDDNIVHSPGGGSIRTISHDILSGILAHCDLEENTVVKDSTLPQHRPSTEPEPSHSGALLHSRNDAPLSDPVTPAPDINAEIRKELAEVQQTAPEPDTTAEVKEKLENTRKHEKPNANENEDEDENEFMEEIKLDRRPVDGAENAKKGGESKGLLEKKESGAEQTATAIVSSTTPNNTDTAI